MSFLASSSLYSTLQKTTFISIAERSHLALAFAYPCTRRSYSQLATYTPQTAVRLKHVRQIWESRMTARRCYE